ncbi:MAG: hypothetical protein ACNYPI_11180 [Arenicellales bacterium WSBS_2016_MAG_OTU3]
MAFPGLVHKALYAQLSSDILAGQGEWNLDEFYHTHIYICLFLYTYIFYLFFVYIYIYFFSFFLLICRLLPLSRRHHIFITRAASPRFTIFFFAACLPLSALTCHSPPARIISRVIACRVIFTAARARTRCRLSSTLCHHAPLYRRHIACSPARAHITAARGYRHIIFCRARARLPHSPALSLLSRRAVFACCSFFTALPRHRIVTSSRTPLCCATAPYSSPRYLLPPARFTRSLSNMFVFSTVLYLLPLYASYLLLPLPFCCCLSLYLRLFFLPPALSFLSLSSLPLYLCRARARARIAHRSRRYRRASSFFLCSFISSRLPFSSCIALSLSFYSITSLPALSAASAA